MNMIQITVGDWSGDGHGKSTLYSYELPEGVTAEDARAAFWRSVEKYPLLNPCSFVCDSQDGTVPKNVIDAAETLGFEWRKTECGGVVAEVDFWVEDMAHYVAWFLSLSGVTLTALSEDHTPTLHFYGYDDQKRHIGYFGYGLYD